MCSVRWGGVVTWLCLKLCFSVVKFHWFSELGPCLDPALVKAKLSTRFSSSNLQSSPAASLKISVRSFSLAFSGVSIFHVFHSSLESFLSLSSWRCPKHWMRSSVFCSAVWYIEPCSFLHECHNITFSFVRYNCLLNTCSSPCWCKQVWDWNQRWR